MMTDETKSEPNGGSNQNMTQCNTVQPLDIIHRDAIGDITVLWEQISAHLSHNMVRSRRLAVDVPRYIFQVVH